MPHDVPKRWFNMTLSRISGLFTWGTIMIFPDTWMISICADLTSWYFKSVAEIAFLCFWNRGPQNSWKWYWPLSVIIRNHLMLFCHSISNFRCTLCTHLHHLKKVHKKKVHATILYMHPPIIRLIQEILHHLRCIKPCRLNNGIKEATSTGESRISVINSTSSRSPSSTKAMDLSNSTAGGFATPRWNTTVWTRWSQDFACSLERGWYPCFKVIR